jgi:uncharacterized protein related to proFAR isomerase
MARPVTQPLLELLPAVDVAGGQAVRLVQGLAGTETNYGDPLAAALDWQRGGAEWIHLVDLDAAFGRGTNAELLESVIAALDVRVELSGGIRDDASLERALRTGAKRVNIGTAALEDGAVPTSAATSADGSAAADDRQAATDPRVALAVVGAAVLSLAVALCFALRRRKVPAAPADGAGPAVSAAPADAAAPAGA